MEKFSYKTRKYYSNQISFITLGTSDAIINWLTGSKCKASSKIIEFLICPSLELQLYSFFNIQEYQSKNYSSVSQSIYSSEKHF